MKKILCWMGKGVFGGMLGLLFCIGCRSAKVEQYLQDVDYQFERQLLHWSQIHLEPALYETVKKEFECLIGGE